MTVKDPMDKFEVGKYYRHETGEVVHVLGITDMDLGGICMFADSSRYFRGFKLFGARAREHWSEISRETWYWGVR